MSEERRKECAMKEVTMERRRGLKREEIRGKERKEK